MAHPEICPVGEIVALLSAGGSMTPQDRSLLEVLKGDVEDEIRQYVRHNVTQPDSPYVEFYPRETRQMAEPSEILRLSNDKVAFETETTEGKILQLDHIFVRDDSNLEVVEDLDAYFGMESDDFPSDDILTKGDDYYLELNEPGLSKSGRLIRRVKAWPSREGTVKVTYIAGLTAAELDGQYRFVKAAVREETILRFKLAKSRSGTEADGVYPVRSESIGGEYSVGYDTSMATAGGGLSRNVIQRLQPIVNWGAI